MPDIAFLKQVKAELSQQDVTLVAVSKLKPVSDILELYEARQRVFGENRVQELVEKQAQLPDDIEWHMIGHLQRKKVRQIAGFVSLIHSIDSAELLEEVNKRGKQHERIIPCLLQFHIAQEQSKYGFSLDEARALLESEVFKSMRHVQIHGVMGMATFTNDMDQVRSEFKTLTGYFEQLKKDYFPNSGLFKEISMGMSGDFEIAIAEGSTMVRIGSKLFGSR